MNKPFSKRSRPWARVAVYSVMTLSVVLLVGFLMLIVLGYSFNERDGRLEQGGLLQFGSIPTGAVVTLDELTLSSRTNSKATVDAGTHSIDFQLSGYKNWKKTIKVGPGEIGWVNYARLVPSVLEPERLRTFQQVSSSLESPRQNFILALTVADRPEFELINIQSDTVRYTTLSLPQDTYTLPDEGKSHSFVIDEWSRNENAALIKHTYNDGQVEWIYLDRENPNKSLNINTTFGIEPSVLEFGGDGSRLLFVQTDDIVRRINMDDLTLSRPLASKIARFSVYNEKTVTYVTTDIDGKRSVGYATTDIAQPVEIGEYPSDDKQLFATMETYFNKRYVSMLYGDKLTIVGGDLPTLTNKGSLKSVASITVPEGVQELLASRNGRFTIVRTAEGFSTYDLELKKFDNTKWNHVSTVQRPLNWLDDYILWSDINGDLRIYDFDGANQQAIMKVVEGNAVTLSDNDKFLYGFTASDKGVNLSRVKMIIN